MMIHKYYTLRRPPMPGGIPSGAVETGELSERIRINGLGTAWGYACYDHELTVGEMADYELAYCEAYEASEPAPAPATVEVSEIAPDHITAAGVEMPAEYRTSSTGRSITATLTMEGERYRVVFSGVCGELFTACQRATRGEVVAVDPDDLMTVLGTARQVKAQAPREVNPDKERHGEVPEKLFIGSELTGKSWRIVFDGEAGKTRVIFPRKPSTAVLEAVKAAGFYWSPSMKSWNKGLTFRAFRAAQALHAELHKLTA